MDLRRNGELTTDTLREVLHLAGERVSESEIRNMLRMVDADNQGSVSFDEFRRIFENPPTIFKNFDVSGVAEAQVGLRWHSFSVSMCLVEAQVELRCV